MLANYKVSVKHVLKSQLISPPLKVRLSLEHFFEQILYFYLFHTIVTSLSQLQTWIVGKLGKEMAPEWVIHWRAWSKFCAKGLRVEHPVTRRKVAERSCHGHPAEAAGAGYSTCMQRLHLEKFQTHHAHSFQKYPACPCQHHCLIPEGWAWKPPQSFKDLCAPSGFGGNWLRGDLALCE